MRSSFGRGQLRPSGRRPRRAPRGAPTGVLHSLKGGGRKAELSRPSGPVLVPSGPAPGDELSLRVGQPVGQLRPLVARAEASPRGRPATFSIAHAMGVVLPQAAARLFSSVRVPLGTPTGRFITLPAEKTPVFECPAAPRPSGPV